MSSRRKAPAAPRGKAAKPAGAPKESKAPRGPIVTPQALGIVFALAALVMLGVLINNNNKANAELANIANQINSQNTLIQTYETKGKKKDEADKLNKALKQKLNTLDYLFLDNQDSLVPFFEQTLIPLIDGSSLQPDPDDAKLKVTAYTFQINMAMRPFDTLPNSSLFDDAANVFKIQYVPEQNGQPWETPLDTRPTTFLEPYDITLEGFWGTYNDVKRFVKSAQQARTKDTLITVHCVKSDEGKLRGNLRTETQWKIQMTVYFMNSEQPATGDAPPAPPGSRSC